MISVEDANQIMDAFEEAHIKVVCFLPESRLKPLYTMLLNDSRFEVITVPNESTGVCITAGAWIGGKRSVMIMENSGVRVACEALARIGLERQIPIFIMMAYRGDFGEENWWGVNHGITMEPVLHALRIPYQVVRHSEDLKPAIHRAVLHAETSMYHTCVVVGRSVIS